MMNITKNKSLVIGACCILMAAGVIEEATFRMTLLAIALIIGVVLAWDVLKSENSQ